MDSPGHVIPRSAHKRHFLLYALLPAVYLTLHPCSHAFSQGGKTYSEQLEAWHHARLKELRSETGWLNLAGLFWLDPGRQEFGGSPNDKVSFPAGKIPPGAGAFNRIGDTVFMTVKEGIKVTLGEVPVSETLAFHPDMPSPPTFRHGSLAWTLIRRGDRIGVRLRDLDHPALMSFKGVERYPADSAWRISARLEKPPYPRYIPVSNVLGQTTPQPSPGTLVFEYRGVRHSLEALEEGENLFILFADESNGTETYPSGRFLYASKPGPDGAVILDFNKSINPPCAFTPFATCPLPPSQNRLTLYVNAGERNVIGEKH